ncbi:MAG: hypothetical protein UU31_C0003G0151 [Candidatus Uhrbacteria bacterium GW2011_GWA2_41_10]|nr:MAG: hypothetical protein UU31_C0003G0151 [Candidatus Uhrbacteria bacterium GW2011_GWA2_41_10]
MRERYYFMAYGHRDSGSGGFRGGKKFRGQDSWGRGSGGRSGSGRPSTMFQATCSECGNDCEVPFKPVSGRPVFCSKCFRKDDDGGSSNGSFAGFRDSRSDNFSLDEKRMFSATCAKCGNQCDVPFKPTGEKPVYCRECFGTSASHQNRGGGDTQIAEQLKAISAKLDAILRAVTPTFTVPLAASKKEVPLVKEESKIEEVIEVVKESKAEKKKAVTPKKETKKKAPAKKK